VIPARDHHSSHTDLQWWLTHKLVGCALAAAFASLCLAAANALSLAGRAAIVAVGCVIAAALQWVYRNLPPHEQRRVLSPRTVARDLLVSTGLGIAVASAYWFGSWVPVRTPQFVDWLWLRLDFVPALFAQLLPVDWQSGFHRHFNRSTYCFPGPFWWETMRYLRVAIPGYVLTFLGLFPLARLARAAR
jgi:hypothetical protein